LGRIATVQKVENIVDDGVQLPEVTADPHGGSSVRAEHFADPGDDSFPLPGDAVAIEPGVGTGTEQATGYNDPKTPRKAAGGEKRIYSRKPTGELAAELWLKGDGTVVLKVYGDSPIQIETDGQVVVNSPNVCLGDGGGQPIARIGDFVTGTVAALSAAPGSPIVPAPPGTPGAPFAAQIVSGAAKSKAS
jgi:hypothetical protein